RIRAPTRSRGLVAVSRAPGFRCPRARASDPFALRRDEDFMTNYPAKFARSMTSMFKWAILFVVATLFLGGCAAFFGYNSLVTRQEEVSRQWANVEVVLQRRADLIPNLVEVVRAYAEHEQGVFT